MELNVGKNGILEISKLYNPIKLKCETGDLSICLRDNGFHFSRNNKTTKGSNYTSSMILTVDQLFERIKLDPILRSDAVIILNQSDYLFQIENDLPVYITNDELVNLLKNHQEQKQVESVLKEIEKDKPKPKKIQDLKVTDGGSDFIHIHNNHTPNHEIINSYREDLHFDTNTGVLKTAEEEIIDRIKNFRNTDIEDKTQSIIDRVNNHSDQMESYVVTANENGQITTESKEWIKSITDLPTFDFPFEFMTNTSDIDRTKDKFISFSTILNTFKNNSIDVYSIDFSSEILFFYYKHERFALKADNLNLLYNKDGRRKEYIDHLDLFSGEKFNTLLKELIKLKRLTVIDFFTLEEARNRLKQSLLDFDSITFYKIDEENNYLFNINIIYYDSRFNKKIKNVVLTGYLIENNKYLFNQSDINTLINKKGVVINNNKKDITNNDFYTFDEIKSNEKVISFTNQQDDLYILWRKEFVTIIKSVGTIKDAFNKEIPIFSKIAIDKHLK